MDYVIYNSFSTASAPYDTIAINSYSAFVKLKLNNSDSLMGSNFLNYSNDTSKVSSSYHDNISISYNWDNKTATIDTINPKTIFLMPPFLIKVRALLNYALSNRDSVENVLKDFKDSIQITFQFKDKLVEFINKPYVYPVKGTISKYTLWIYKDFRPYRLIRKMPHQTTIEQISYLNFNSCNVIQEKQTGIYIPEGFTIQNKKGIKITTSEIEGHFAPNWVLENVEGDTIRLSDFKGKNLLIEFTGVGCGPCHLSVPLLKKLAEESKNNGFNIVSIENNSKNKSGLKRYKDMNKINYEFLIAVKKTTKDYKIYALPTFVFINKNGKIEKIILGYSKDKTDNEILDLMNRMK